VDSTMLNSMNTKSIVLRSLRVFSRKERTKLLIITGIQISLSFLDLLGVALIGVLGALSVNGVQSKQPGDRVFRVLEFLQIEDFQFQTQAAILGIAAASVLVLKTCLSIIFTKKSLHFLSQRSASITGILFSRFLNQNLIEVQKKSAQENLYSMTVGVQSITVGLIGSLISMVADFSMLLLLIIGLAQVDLLIAFSTVGLFATIGLVLYFLMQKKATSLGQDSSDLTIESNQQILEALDSFREIFTRNRLEYYTRRVTATRKNLASVNADMTFMPNVSKYVIETSIVIGALVIGGLQFSTQDATNAVASLSVFLAAGSRIAPGVLRIQQGLIQVRSSLGIATPTLLLIESLKPISPLPLTLDQLDTSHKGFDGSLVIQDVSLTYPGNQTPALSNITIEVLNGSTIALVGPSGAGKTTLADVILGLIDPSEGSVTLSGLKPKAAIAKWPGAIAYVPQNVTIMNDSILENLLVGYSESSISSEDIQSALEIAQLHEFVKESDAGINSKVGDKGLKISGGQRQRIGIARALVTKPKMLVLDEATSALDGQTEAAIAEAIGMMKGKTTLIIVAHRLSTVKSADKIIYLDRGRLVASGTFEELRSQVPDFDLQANLMGL
jgi:ABC-type multidrug transport system fused ATPase/permease subunit